MHAEPGIDRRQYAAAIQMLFFMSGIYRLAELTRRSVIHMDNIHSLLGAALAAIAGVSIGTLILNRIAEKKFRRGIAFFLLILAVRHIMLIAA